MHAYALEILKENLKEGGKALDVGSGTGYLCACFAMMVGKRGKVVGVEHIDDLVKKSINNLNNWNSDMLKYENIKIHRKLNYFIYPVSKISLIN
jgi:protein-L-isoaspartate(D-aspartate) O-methyltransferase